MSMKLSDIAILNIKILLLLVGSYYCFIISLISKNKAMNLMQNPGFTEKSGT